MSISFSVKRRKKRNSAPAPEQAVPARMIGEVEQKFCWTPVRQSLSEALKSLPDAPTAEEYNRVPVDEFARRLSERGSQLANK